MGAIAPLPKAVVFLMTPVVVACLPLPELSRRVVKDQSSAKYAPHGFAKVPIFMPPFVKVAE